ncbi:MAG: DUF945 domain-containing protein [Planctomycetota bacterium]|nr:DUF945 domain-containing protein [Planctomycetota bacterium]
MPSAGIRNSHDKSFALSILSGARVLVCANGVLSAEHVISRKHTSGLELRVEVDRALDAFIESTSQFHATYDRLRGKSLTKARAHHLVVELARAGAIASSDILPVVQEFEQPRHPEFRDRNAWTLYQSATENHEAPVAGAAGGWVQGPERGPSPPGQLNPGAAPCQTARPFLSTSTQGERHEKNGYAGSSPAP